MEEQVERLVRKVWGKFQDTPKSKRLLIAVSGIPGSGKTTLAATVTKQLNALYAEEKPALSTSECIAAFLPVDGYHLSETQVAAMPASSTNTHAPAHPAFTFDAQAFVELVHKLREPILPETKTIYASQGQRRDKEEADAVTGETVSIPKASRIIVMEGNYLSLGSGAPEWKEAAAVMDELWFVDVEEDVARDRLIKKHVTSGTSPDKHEAAKRADERDLCDREDIIDGANQVQERVRSHDDEEWRD